MSLQSFTHPIHKGVQEMAGITGLQRAELDVDGDMAETEQELDALARAWTEAEEVDEVCASNYHRPNMDDKWISCANCGKDTQAHIRQFAPSKSMWIFRDTILSLQARS